jgi:hypothetical protein
MCSLFSIHTDQGIHLSTVLEWYKIRDTLFGRNFVSQNIPLAIEKAAACEHPGARWLTETCAGKDVQTVEDVKRIFSTLDQDDARALCFGFFGERHQGLAPLRRSADLGFAFAQALLAEQTPDLEEKGKFAKLAAAQGERDGHFWRGEYCGFYRTKRCEAKESLLQASNLGHVLAMARLGYVFDESDPQRWFWLGQAALRGNSWRFATLFAQKVEAFRNGSESAAVVFAIGQALQGHVNEEKHAVFNFRLPEASPDIGSAKTAVVFYEGQIRATKDAMKAWTLVGIRLNVVKDVRKLIAKLIWDLRGEALYQ